MMEINGSMLRESGITKKSISVIVEVPGVLSFCWIITFWASWMPSSKMVCGFSFLAGFRKAHVQSHPPYFHPTANPPKSHQSLLIPARCALSRHSCLGSLACGNEHNHCRWNGNWHIQAFDQPRLDKPNGFPSTPAPGTESKLGSP